MSVFEERVEKHYGYKQTELESRAKDLENEMLRSDMKRLVAERALFIKVLNESRRVRAAVTGRVPEHFSSWDEAMDACKPFA